MNRFSLITFITLAIAAVMSCQQKEGAQKLSAPTPVLVDAGQFDATFIWETVKNADSYEFVLNDGQSFNVKGTSYTLENLEEATEYSVKMKALAPEGSTAWLDSDYSEPLAFTTAGKKKLVTPTLKAADVLSYGFKVTWNNVNNAAKYVYVVGEEPETVVYTTNFVVTGLNYNTDYAVKVKAVPADDKLAYYAESDWATLTVTTANVQALAALTLQSSNITSSEFTISWEAVPHAVKYVCQLADGAPVEVTETSVMFDGLGSQKSYIVKVYAVAADSNLQSPVAQITVTTKKGPSPDDKDSGLSDFEEKPIF